MDFTIAIPTYNGAKRLPAVFQALERQQDISDITWEVLVVDNNSQDETAQVVQQWQGKSLNFPVRYCFEPQQGLAFARKKAINEAKGEWVAFVDDDNWPQQDWLNAAARFRNHSPQLGAFNGKITGAYEVDPPDGFEKIKAFLVIRNHGNQPKKFVPENLDLPPGAGLFVKRSAWIAAANPHPKLIGRVGASMFAGEDGEQLLYLYKSGWEIWYNPNLCISHQIPASRFDRSYLLTLAKGCGLPTFQLLLVLSKSPLETIILFFRTLLGNARRLILHRLKYGNRIDRELVPGFLWAFYWGSFLSPFVKGARLSPIKKEGD
jgi:glycosyltransferase involved in cell wall biosynthesis